MAKIVGAMVSEISKNRSMLPRFKLDVEREFHDANSFEHLRVDFPILRVPVNFVTRSIAGM